MDIRISQHIKHYVGPSQEYYNAQNRFETILKDKLGVENKEKIKIDNNSSAIFDEENLENPNIESNIQNPIFFENIKLSRDEFSSSKPLSKSINSLAINGILDTNDIRKKSNYSAQYIDSKLENTPLAGLGEHFKRAEDLYGVNSIVLLAMAKLESNFGRSKIAMDKNNLFGYQAYDSSPYKSAKFYEHKQDSIYDVAKHLSKNYLSPNGPYFYGYSVDSIGVKYSTDTQWSSKVKKIASELVKG